VSGVYYNEIDPFAAAWLRELMKAKQIPDGEVDERSIELVRPDDLRGFHQCHFFAGIGGWAHALRLAGWPDDREVWTGSCPCQRFSAAARGRAVADDMWPEFRRLIFASLPVVVFGEQVPHAGDWFDGVCDDLESVGYEIGAAILPALCVGADHARPRIYFVGDTHRYGEPIVRVDAEVAGMSWRGRDTSELVPPNGLSRDMVALSGFGNAIVPQVAQVFIEAYLAARGEITDV